MPDFAAMRKKSKVFNDKPIDEVVEEDDDVEYIRRLKQQLKNKSRHIQELQSKLSVSGKKNRIRDELQKESEFVFQNYDMEQLYVDEPPQQDLNDYSKIRFNKAEQFAKAVSNHIVKKALKQQQEVKVQTYFEPTDSIDSREDLRLNGRSELDYNKSLLNEVEQRYGNLRFDASQMSYNY